VRLAPSAPSLQRARPAVPGAAFVVGSLIAVLAVSWFAVVTQPSALATTAWWPAAGIALGLGIRFPRKDVWMVALAVGVLSLPVALYAGRPGPLAVVLSIGAGVELVVGTLILRGRNDRLPTLAEPRDIGRLLGAVITAAVVYVLLSARTATVGSSSEATHQRPRSCRALVRDTPD